MFHPAQDPAIAPGIHLAERLGDMPILGGNSVEVLSDYDGILDRLVADIDAARAHVHLLFYIIADDAVAGRVIAALERAAARGVACRVLADALGSRGVRFDDACCPGCTPRGSKPSETMRVAFFRQRGARMDLRNHRKIAVIDGRIGYTGSLNLVDPNFKPGLTYEELMVRATGPVVLELQAIFAQDWYLETGQPLETGTPFPDPEVTGAVPAQVLPSSPLFARPNNQRLIVALVNAARQRAVITTPYFIPDEALLQALTTAVLRGVDVRLVVPAQDDQLLVSNAQKSYYGELLQERRAHLPLRQALPAREARDDRRRHRVDRLVEHGHPVVRPQLRGGAARVRPRRLREAARGAGTVLRRRRVARRRRLGPCSRSIRQVGWNLARMFSSVL